MNRACIFAHYDKDNIIDDYVIYYIKELAKVSDTLVFVSDCDLPAEQIAKIKEYADIISAEKHGKYDFGSYQKGYNLIKENLHEYNELLICNDSCYGPLFELKNVFEQMQDKECDFWGLTLNRGDTLNKIPVPEHLQSFFLVFKKPVLESSIFHKFIESIKKEANKFDIIEKYEIGCTTTLAKAGFKYLPYIESYENTPNLTRYKWKEIIKDGFPLIKVVLMRDSFKRINIFDWKDFIKEQSDYPIEMIEKHIRRVRTFKSYRRLFELRIHNLLQKIGLSKSK